MSRLAWALVLAPALAHAAPIELTWQARALDAAGAPLSGTHDVVVTLWGDEARTPPALWTDTFSGVVLSDGFFAVVLGSGLALDGADLPEGGAWLEVQVGTGNPAVGPVPVREVPYAVRARGVSLDDPGACGAATRGAFRLVSDHVSICDGSEWRIVSRGRGGDGSSAAEAGSSCLQIHQDFPTVASGTRYIDPVGGGAFLAYCDMNTDGGGWTLVGNWAAMSGYAMSSYPTGRLPGELAGSGTAVRPGGSGAGQGPSHYGEAVISALFHSGSHQYLSLTGRSTSGWILTRHTMSSYNPSFDAFRGIFATEYLKNTGAFTAVYEASATNQFILPRATPGWVSATVTGRSCPSGDGSNCYHYLPDDIAGGGQWLFRENSDDTPTTAYTSSLVPSLLFIR